MKARTALIISALLMSTVASAQSRPGLSSDYVALCKTTLKNAVSTGAMKFEMTKLGARAIVDESAWHYDLDWATKATLAKSLACVAAGVGGNINKPYVAIYSDRTNKMLASGTVVDFTEK